MPSVYQRAKRLTAQQRRMRTFEEAMYQTLRQYQDGEFTATSGVAAGCLTVPLTTVFDKIRAAASETFK